MGPQGGSVPQTAETSKHMQDRFESNMTVYVIYLQLCNHVGKLYLVDQLCPVCEISLASVQSLLSLQYKILRKEKKIKDAATLLVILIQRVFFQYVYGRIGANHAPLKASTIQFMLISAFIPGLHHWQCQSAPETQKQEIM